ncbi:hypothetical protein [Chitinophaga sp.]|uniref:hypothetical protein n=1 Tax=Chitinophaga sp. TaxID=1869181 RepID=UPI0031D576AB
MDTFGNLLPDTTRVGFSIIHPDKAGTSGKDRLYGGIAAVDISGGTISGKGFAMATVGAVASREMDFLEVSGDPIDFRIKASVHSTFADGRQTFKIFSDRLVDKYGNILPEGSIVYFNCYEGNDSIRTITGYTIGGIATIYLQNPVRTGVFKVNAVTATGAESNTVVLVFNTPKFEY